MAEILPDIIPSKTWKDIFGGGLLDWPIPRLKDTSSDVLINPRIIGGTIEGGADIDKDEYLTFTFYEASISQATGKGIPKTIVVDRSCTIVEVYAQVETAPGSAKTLTVDVNKNGTTIFTTQGNRPSITGTGTTDTSGTPDVIALTKNDLLTMDIDTHDGVAAKLSVYVRCSKQL